MTARNVPSGPGVKHSTRWPSSDVSFLPARREDAITVDRRHEHAHVVRSFLEDGDATPTEGTLPHAGWEESEGTAGVSDVSREFVSGNPGRHVQRVGTPRFLDQDVAKVHDPVWGVIGTLGDSQCYLGVQSKVAAVHAALAKRIHDDDLPVRLIAPAFTLGVSDGQLNGTDRMRYSLTSRELVNDSTEAHLKANDMAGIVAVVACDKPPVGTLAAVLEHNAPALLLSDGSIHPGLDPVTGEPIDLVTAFQHAADPDPGCASTRAACVSGPGKLRRDVHVQHHADVHRCPRHGTPAHGRSGI